jgi:hypothetical protein
MPEIPKIFHFVLAGKSASADTATAIKSWVATNPGWKAMVWCDSATMGQNHAVAAGQDPNVEIKTIDTLVAVPGPSTAPGASSCGAASDIARLNILQKFGCLYVDSNVIPGAPLPSLSVGDGSALFLRAKPGKPRDSAIACTIGSQRIKSLLATCSTNSATATRSPAPLEKTTPILDADLPDQCFTATASASTRG